MGDRTFAMSSNSKKNHMETKYFNNNNGSDNPIIQLIMNDDDDFELNDELDAVSNIYIDFVNWFIDLLTILINDMYLLAFKF